MTPEERQYLDRSNERRFDATTESIRQIAEYYNDVKACIKRETSPTMVTLYRKHASEWKKEIKNYIFNNYAIYGAGANRYKV